METCVGLLVNDAEQIVGRERRERVSQLARCGGGCFDSRRRVNSNVVRFSKCYDLPTHQSGFTEKRTERYLFGCEAT